MLDTSELQDLLEWMRVNRVTRARLGDLELTAELPQESDSDNSGLDIPSPFGRGESESMYLSRDLWNGEPPECIRRAMPKASKDDDGTGSDG